MNTLKDVSQDPTQPSSFNANNAVKRMEAVMVKVRAATAVVKAAHEDCKADVLRYGAVGWDADRRFQVACADFETISAQAKKILNETGVLLANAEAAGLL